MIFDEVDGYPASAGTEGDQLELGIKRTEYYWNRKILAGSTPTLTGHSRIERLFEAGDQRRYYVPCPTCGAMHVLRFVNLKWPDGRPERAAFVCPVNGCEIRPESKPAMIAAGEWRAEKPEHFAMRERARARELPRVGRVLVEPECRVGATRGRVSRGRRRRADDASHLRQYDARRDVARVGRSARVGAAP